MLHYSTHLHFLAKSSDLVYSEEENGIIHIFIKAIKAMKNALVQRAIATVFIC